VSERPFSQALGPPGVCAVVAHRGASAQEAENTLAAFDRAIEAGADAIEFDVRITGDGQAVVMHDPDVARTTDGAGLVQQMSLEKIQALGIALRGGGSEQIPTLAEALAGCSGRAAVDIEIKNIPGEPDFDPRQEAAVEATLRALDEVGFSGEVLISSFNPLSIARAKELDPAIATGLLSVDVVEARDAFGYAHEQGHDWILPSVASVRAAGPAFPAEVHAAGMRLGTWITDDPEEAVTLMRTGVDAVATNDPGAIVVARRAAGLA
jgi:glycerophosphoryl diester phosphodiesterase